MSQCLKKVPTFKLSVTLSNLNRFSKFLHCWKAYEICYKTTTLPTATGICVQNFAKIGSAVPKICSRTDRQMHTQTDKQTSWSQYCAPLSGRSKNVAFDRTVDVMPSSHRRHGQDKTRLSWLVLVCGVNWIGDKSRQVSVVLNIFETEQLQIENWLKAEQNCLVLSAIQFTPPTRTRQDKTVLFRPRRRCEIGIVVLRVVPGAQSLPVRGLKGGMKAVMWTDVVQICFMFTGIIAVIIKGSVDHGGFNNIWSIMYDDERIQFWEWVDVFFYILSLSSSSSTHVTPAVLNCCKFYLSNYSYRC